MSRVSFAKELRLLKKLQSFLFLVPADKAANKTIFVCKRLYCHVLRSETQRSDGAYHGVPDSAESIVERHTLSLRRFGLTPDNNLPRFSFGYRQCTSHLLATASFLLLEHAGLASRALS